MDAQTDGRVAKTPRVEDDVLVRGNGRYAADVAVPGQVYACFVRSPHAFARIAHRQADIGTGLQTRVRRHNLRGAGGNHDFAFALPGGAKESYFELKSPLIATRLADLAPLWEMQ